MAKLPKINIDDQIDATFGTYWEEIIQEKQKRTTAIMEAMLTAVNPIHINCRCISELTEEDKAARKAPQLKIKIGGLEFSDFADAEDRVYMVYKMSDEARDKAIANKRKLREDNQ